MFIDRSVLLLQFFVVVCFILTSFLEGGLMCLACAFKEWPYCGVLSRSQMWQFSFHLLKSVETMYL